MFRVALGVAVPLALAAAVARTRYGGAGGPPSAAPGAE
jgi:hypothetical protein